jgi:serine/threonine protein phosphatase PrpC
MSDKSSDKSSNQSSNQSPEKGMDESKEEAKVLGGAQDDTLEVTPKDELGEITDAKLESLDDGTTSTLFSDVPESQTDSVKDEKFEQIASISDQKLGGEQTDLESDKPVIEITLRIEEGNNIADTIQSTLKILKKQTLEYGKFNEDYTSEVKIAIEHTTNIENVSVNSQFSNILGNKEYSYVEHKNNVIRIQGRPEAGYDDTIIFKLKFMTIKDKEIFSKIENVEKELFIAPDPKSMWKVLPVTDETYDGYTSPNDDIKSKHLEDINKILLAASCRGRSHATKGLPRDDNFYFDCNNNNGWKVMAVADGAGSAKYSRKGSEIACKRSVQLFLEEAVQQQLSTICYNDKIQEWKNYYTNNLHSDNTDNIQANGFRSDFTLDDIISAIVFKVFKEIKDESCQKNDSKQDTQVTVHDYNTTLLFLAFKKFDFGYFFISFWIGDGALILYDLNKTGKIVLLGNPDTGEFAGQTLFLTTQSEMVPEKIKNKICYAFADDFESILMMTDGVSDAYFQSDNSLKSPESWKTFWNHVLKHGDDQDEQNKGCPEIFDPSQPLDSKASSLRKWLDFWSTGNHDDRTILIVKD